MSFTELLDHLSSSDNVARAEAERQFQQLKADPTTMVQVPSMLLSLVSSADASAGTVAAAHRQLAAVLLRRMLLEEDSYSKLPEDV
jgi:hypothetical protein